MFPNYDKWGARTYFKPFERPMKDLLLEQSKGKVLTLDEMNRVRKYAEEQRKKKKNK